MILYVLCTNIKKIVFGSFITSDISWIKTRGSRFLIGEGENAAFDKEIVERINDIQKMDPDTRSILFNVIDTYIQNFKTKQAFR